MAQKTFLLIAGFLTLLGIIYLLTLLKVSSIECRLADGSGCPQSLSDTVTKAATGKPMFFYDFATLFHSEPFAQLPFTLEGHSKRLPATLIATFENEPAFYLLKTSDSTLMPIGTRGTIVQSNTWPENLPQVNIELSSQEVTNEEVLADKIHQPLSSLLNSLYKNQVVFQNVTWVNKDEIRLELETNQQVILNTDNPSIAVDKLSLLLKSEELDFLDGEIKEIDLRLNMPVLRTNQ